MVVGEGFEPSKAQPSDLQSDPFDHSGTPPLSLNCPAFRASSDVSLHSARMFLHTAYYCVDSGSRQNSFRTPTDPKPEETPVKRRVSTPPFDHPAHCHGAATKNRTRDLLITSELLYQLSYGGQNGSRIL